MTRDATHHHAHEARTADATPPLRPVPPALRPASGLVLGLMLSAALWLMLLVLWLTFR